MFKDYCLCAADEAALKAALPWAVHAEDIPDGPRAGDWKAADPTLYALDLIGPMQVVDAVYGDDCVTVITPGVVDDAFHANLRLVAAYAPDVPVSIQVFPRKPLRVFAG